MNPRFTYLLVDFFCIIIPVIFSFHPKIKFNRQFRYFWKPCLFTALIFVAWDIWFTHIGIWEFNPRYVSGLYFINLPIEEVLFFICIPYACVFTYHCLCGLVKLSPTDQGFFNALTISAIILFVAGACFFNRYYTSLTFTGLALLLLFIARRRETFIKHFFLCYLLILIPFFISNGILTGAFTDEPIVIYNNSYNLGLRMWSIPVEDLFYGMLLLLLNVRGYESSRQKFAGDPAPPL
ncbi:MAG: lycopene cyclase domain-containing protein [Bacteroidota bacterium]